MESSLLVSLIIGVLTIGGNIAIGLLQRRLWKSQAKKSDTEAYTEIVKTITEKTESDFGIMKSLNEQLVKQNTALELKLETCRKEQDFKEIENDKLRGLLKDCESKTKKET
jgi:hypothetical protein